MFGQNIRKIRNKPSINVEVNANKNPNMTKKLILGLVFCTLFPLTSMAQRLLQPMGRGVVVTYRKSTERSVTASGGNGYLVSWRKLAQEPEGTTYNVYRRTGSTGEFTKVNSTPLKVTNYKPSSVAAYTEWAVTAITPDGTEGSLSKPFLYTTQPLSSSVEHRRSIGGG